MRVIIGILMRFLKNESVTYLKSAIAGNAFVLASAHSCCPVNRSCGRVLAFELPVQPVTGIRSTTGPSPASPVFTEQQGNL
jgi:hypothetical protein